MQAMPQMSIFKVLHSAQRPPHAISYSTPITFLLLDEEQQRLLALQLWESSPTSTQVDAERRAVPTEQLTNDFLAGVLHALGGTLEEIDIDTRPDGRLYARLHLRNQRGLHTVNSSLNDALRLAHREQSRISVSEEILVQRAVSLENFGTTRPERLTEISRRAEQNPDSLHRSAREPLNLDFSNGLRGWNFSRDSTEGSYVLDPHTTLTGRSSLAITLHKPFTHGSSGILLYGDSLAEHYRGQRVRLSAYVKTEQMHQPDLELLMSWPTNKISPLTGRLDSACCLTRSRIVPHAEEGSWARHEMVIDVPTQARHLRFQVGTHEQGKLWLDGIELVTVDQSVALTGTILRPPPQQPLNLDFSKGLEYWETKGNALRHYVAGIDTTATTSAYLKSVVEDSIGSCILQQMLSLENYQGKVLRLTASLKTLDVVSHASLFIGSFLSAREDQVEQAVLTGTNPWTTYTLDWPVRVEKRRLGFGLMAFGISLQGCGQCWVQDIHLQALHAKR